MNPFNPKLQHKNTEFAIKLKDLLPESTSSKLATTLVLEFKKIENDDGTKKTTLHSNSKTEAIINESDNDDTFQSMYSTIIPKIHKSLRTGSS